MALNIGIIGAGIGGLTAAIALRQKGHSAHLIERATELGEVGAAVSLWPNALAALDRLGLEEHVRAQGHWEEDGALRRPSGDPYWMFNNRNLIILRPSLQQVLLHATGQDLPLTLGSRCTGVRTLSDRPTVFLDDMTTHEYDLVIGADGLRSRVRAAIAPEDRSASYSGSTAWRAVVHAPGLVPTAWLTVGRGLHFLAAPLPDDDVYWSPVVRIPVSEVEAIDDQLEFVRRCFGTWHSPIPELLEATEGDACFATPVYFRPPPTWIYRGRVVLIGDAAHPMTPDLGQGACQAIEDAVVLADCLTPNRSIEDSLADFTSRRLRRIRGIVREARFLGKLNSSTSRFCELARLSMFKITPSSYSERHLEGISGRGAFEAQMS
jgi:2-polyprenyl-6-methoxyphenol hydroxylase-like FAD-dependent oxidoreductase